MPARTIPTSVGHSNAMAVITRCELFFSAVAVGMPLNYNTENTNCIVWHLNSAADKDTVITLEPAVSFGGVYRLKLAQRNLYLTVVGSSLKWMAFTNEKDQIFSFCGTRCQSRQCNWQRSLAAMPCFLFRN